MGFGLALSFPYGGIGNAASTAPTFPAGLYYSQPSLQHAGGTIQLLEGTLPVAVEFSGIGFDVSADFVVSVGGSTIVLNRADGTVQHIPVPGRFAMARPSLSPDGKRVAVQATETPVTPPTPPQFLIIYIVDLATGSFTRLVPPNANPATGNELPEWFPSGDRIAHQGVDADCLVVRVYDVATAALLLTIRRNGTTGCYQPLNGVQDGPRFHLTVSRDSSKLLIVGQMQIYDARTGTLLTDLHQSVLNGLAAAGYQPDTRFPGQGGGGTFPLDGTFSTDGKSIVFDGAVERNGTFGVLLMRINVDGSGFTILRGPITVDPRFSNNHNFSQLNPVFFGPPLSLLASVNQPTFVVRQTLSMTIGLTNPGLPGTADFYLGTAQPDGTFEFFTSTGIAVGTLADLKPAATGVSLVSPFEATVRVTGELRVLLRRDGRRPTPGARHCVVRVPVGRATCDPEERPGFAGA